MPPRTQQLLHGLFEPLCVIDSFIRRGQCRKAPGKRMVLFSISLSLITYYAERKYCIYLLIQAAKIDIGLKAKWSSQVARISSVSGWVVSINGLAGWNVVWHIMSVMKKRRRPDHRPVQHLHEWYGLLKIDPCATQKIVDLWEFWDYCIHMLRNTMWVELVNETQNQKPWRCQAWLVHCSRLQLPSTNRLPTRLAGWHSERWAGLVLRGEGKRSKAPPGTPPLYEHWTACYTSQHTCNVQLPNKLAKHAFKGGSGLILYLITHEGPISATIWVKGKQVGGARLQERK